MEIRGFETHHFTMPTTVLSGIGMIKTMSDWLLPNVQLRHSCTVDPSWWIWVGIVA